MVRTEKLLIQERNLKLMLFGQSKLMCWGTDPTNPHFSQIQKKKKTPKLVIIQFWFFCLSISVSQYAIDNT